MAKVGKWLASFCSREDDAAALSRRDMLAGLGLAGLFVAAPKLLLPSAAEAATNGLPAAEPEVPADKSNPEHRDIAENAADTDDVSELSSQRWRRRRRYWRRRHWRRRYWRGRHWRRRYWRRRHWRRRYWRRRYW